MEMVELRAKQRGPEGAIEKGKGKQRATADDGQDGDAAAQGKKGE